MNPLIRFKYSIASTFDWMVSQIENQEGLLDAALRELENARIEALVGLNRARADNKKLAAKIADLTEKASSWKDRAKQAAPTDRERALECARRARRAETDAVAVTGQLDEHDRILKTLEEEVDSIERKLEEIKRQRNILRVRQARAEALTRAGGIDDDVKVSIDRLMTRWDERIARAEYLAVRNETPRDPLEEEFAAKEEIADVEAYLDEIIGR